MSKIVLCVGDSLGMPREGVHFFDTWFYRISQSIKGDFLFINNFRRALTTNDIRSADFLEHYIPHTIILQIGIVDCAPRYFKRDSIILKLVNSGPSFLRNLFWKIVKKIKKRSERNAFVSLEKFRQNIDSYIDRCNKVGVVRLIIINIPTPGTAMIKASPEIVKSISSYNESFGSVYFKGELIVINPLNSGDPDDYLEDGYHLSKQGFDKIYLMLFTLIK